MAPAMIGTGGPSAAKQALVILACLCLFPILAVAEIHEVRVGVYENPPKILLGADGRPDGIFGDLLVEIARREDWSLRAVPCNWAACLQALQSGTIDLLPDVAKTERRMGRFGFHKEPVLHSWSALYARDAAKSRSILDLDGERVAVLQGSVQEDYLRRLFQDFGIAVDLVPVESFDQGFAAVAGGKADAAAVNRYYGASNAARFGLTSSSVVFQPARLFYASPRGAGGALLQTIDDYLASWRAHEGSPYYRVLDRWMGQTPATVLPSWWGWAATATLTVILVVLLLNVMLRRQVRRQTQRLQDDLERIRRADQALSRQHGFFQSLIRTIPDLVWIKDPDGRYLGCNQRFERFFGAREEAIVGQTDYDFVDRELADSFRHHDRAAVAAGEPSTNEEWLTFAADGYRGLFETTKTPMFDAQGQLIGVLGIAHDITERTRARDALVESGELLREAQALAQLGNWNFDLVGRNAVWSDEEYRLYGYIPGGVRPTLRNFLRVVHRQDMKAVLGEIRRVLNPRESRPLHVVHRIVTAAGQRMVEQRGKAVFDGRMRPIRLFGTTADISERVRNEQQIEHMAYHDQLTGLPNRALFLDRLGQALAANDRVKRYGAVLFVDLDQFKRINDVHGHSTGDGVLRQVAGRLRHLLRQVDTVARFGGDEFVILLPELSTEEASAATLAMAVAEKLLAALEWPVPLEGQDHPATASIGITLFPQHGTDMEDLIRQADIAMYRAKDMGRNTLVFFEQHMQAQIADRYALERDLRDAVGKGQLALYLQSQVAADASVTGAEALLRWRHPSRGLLPPGDFIALAEESSLIVEIGEWVLREACRVLVRLHAAGKRLRMAVNVSPRQFHQADFVALVEKALRDTGAAPGHLTLEVTENLLMENTAEVVARMRALAQLGVRFAIDDFGTGYSSLTYLKRLPLDELKIDRGFVHDLPGDASGLALVETILSMARHLNYDVVAEGVESAEQLEVLKDRGCRYFQGYLFDRPQPADDWLARYGGVGRSGQS